MNITVEITATRGSAPREPGTVMVVDQTGIQGTIGGGALEHRAIEKARSILAGDMGSHEVTWPLGPALGQCCGGAVSLRFSSERKPPDGHQTKVIERHLLPEQPLGPLWIWGAGHVGRAFVRLLAPSGAFDLTWVDTKRDRFPDQIDRAVTALPTADMPRLASHAPREAQHLIFTYSHDLDLALCAALLKRGFLSCGVIGSATKWTRFQKRLRAAGLDPSAITCPIGAPSAGKHPDDIAHSTAIDLLRFAQFTGEFAASEKAAS